MAITHFCWTVFIGLLVLGSTEDVRYMPTNVRFQTVNLNSTLLWDPPENATADNVVYYTVRYQEESQLSEEWLQKPECYNITETVCNFGADFNNIYAYWHAQIRVMNNISQAGDWTEPERVQPCCDGIIGRPEFTTVIAYSYHIYLEWLAPETPFSNSDGGYLRMDDVMTVNYNLTYWKTGETENKTQQYLGEDNNVTLTESIEPVMSYEIVLQGETQGKYGIPRHITVSNVIGIPTNIKYVTVNLNSTLTWDRPTNVYDVEDVLYTVRYQEQQRLFHGDDWMVNNDCLNTVSQMCNFGADFEPYFGNWHSQIQAWRSPGDQPGSTWSASVVVCPYYDGIMGPPNITNITAGSDQIYLSWKAPETPYTNIFTGEPKLVSDIMSVYYNYTYCKTNYTDLCQHGSTETKTYVLLQDFLEPWTYYDIKIQGKTNGNYGIPINLVVPTDEAAPSKGVDITIVEVQPPVCEESPDMRNVTINWIPIDEEDHNGVLTHYEVHYSYSDTTLQMQIITDVSATSTLLTGLYRWEQYYITVSVCTSAGCTKHESAPYVLEPDTVALDPPSEIWAEQTSENSFNVSWLPPDNDECITGYNVKCDNGRLSRKTFVRDDLHIHITDVPDSYYTIYVSAEIYSDYNSSVNGSHAVTGINILGMNTVIIYIIIAVILVLTVLIMLAVCVYYEKRAQIKAFVSSPLTRNVWQDYMKNNFNMEDCQSNVNPDIIIEEYDVVLPITDATNVKTSTSTSSSLSESPSNSLNSVNGNNGIELGPDGQMAAAGIEEAVIPAGPSQPSLDTDNYIHRQEQQSERSNAESSNGIPSYSKLRANSCTSSISSDEDENNLSNFLNISLGNIGDEVQDTPNIENEHSGGTESDNGCNSPNTLSGTPSNESNNYSRMTGTDDGSIVLGPNKQTTADCHPDISCVEIKTSTPFLQLSDTLLHPAGKPFSIDDSQVEDLSEIKAGSETLNSELCEDQRFTHLGLSDILYFQDDSSSLSESELSPAEYGMSQCTDMTDQPGKKNTDCSTSCEKPRWNSDSENKQSPADQCDLSQGPEMTDLPGGKQPDCSTTCEKPQWKCVSENKQSPADDYRLSQDTVTPHLPGRKQKFTHLGLSDILYFQDDSFSLSESKLSPADEYGLSQCTDMTDQSGKKQPDCSTSCEKPQWKCVSENKQSPADEYRLSQDTVTPHLPGRKQTDCSISDQHKNDSIHTETVPINVMPCNPNQKNTMSDVQCRPSIDDSMDINVNPLDEFLILPPQLDDVNDILSDDDGMSFTDVADQPTDKGNSEVFV